MLKLLATAILIVVLYAHRGRLKVPLFRLPGDVEIDAGRFKLQIPLTSCLLVCMAVSLIWALACGR